MAEQTEIGGGSAPAAGQPQRPRFVYIVDDDSVVRKSLHFLLASMSITAWPFAAAKDFIDQLADLAPAPILLDIRMADIDGLRLLAILRQREINWPVIMMTAHGDVAMAVRAMKLGAIDFLEKPFTSDFLHNALGQAFGIVDEAEQSLRARGRARQIVSKLSKRESEIVAILMEGAPNKVIAQRLGLSVRTVETHRSNALVKLDVKSIAEVIALVAAADLGPQTPFRSDNPD